MKATAFEKATRRFENWLRKHVVVVERDLEHKYVKMRKDVFSFLRGTFYRWIELWEDRRKELRRAGVLLPKAPEILCVGDLHLENFGTWRDAEGRLVWGINDFDEAYPLKYVNDLVRLATSVKFALAHHTGHWRLSHEDACSELLNGYAAHLNSGGESFVLGHDLHWLWSIATHPSRTPEAFWSNLSDHTREVSEKPLRKLAKQAAAAIRAAAPQGRGIQAHPLKLRRAGVGSLGRPRFIQLFEGRSGHFLREAKPILPSAAVFIGMGKAIRDPYDRILRQAVRVRDPFYSARQGWVVRRLAFDSDEIDVASLNTIRNAKAYFRAMGGETANLHLGTAHKGALTRHFTAQCEAQPKWLYEASSMMAAATQRDFDDFRHSGLGLSRPT